MGRRIYTTAGLVGVMLGIMGGAAGSALAALQVRAVTALEKVRAADPMPGGAGSLNLAAARNEFEAGQLVITGGGVGLSGVDVRASDLVGTGATLPANRISLARVEYYRVTVPSDPTGATGEWPDGLIPKIDTYVGESRNGFPFSVGANRLQAVWVEVYVPRGTPAGTYRGSLTVSAAGESTVIVPFVLTVWDFDLPSTASLPTAFYTGQASLIQGHYGRSYVDDATQITMLKRYTDALLLHRISNQGMVYPAPRWGSGGGVDWTEFDRDWGPYLDGAVALPGGHLPGAKVTSVALQDWGHQGDVSYYRAWASHFRARGWFDRLFHYTLDEPTVDQYPTILSRAAALHAADPGLRSLVTHHLAPSLVGAVDIWTPVINFVDNKSSAEGAWEVLGNHRPDYDGRLAAGDQLWWYQSCMSHGCGPLDGTPVPVTDTPPYFRGWPSYMIDTDGMTNRIMEWLTWTYKVGGELYFHTTSAYEFGYRSPWTARYLFGGNGDGNLFLPGRPDVIGGSTHIPIETVRLKLIREGLEDYEYLAKVAQLGDRSYADAQARTLVTNTYTWSHTPAALYAARTALAQRIVALEGGGAPPPGNQAPVAAATVAASGLTATANGTGSRDPDGSIVSWAWTWGDGAQSSGQTSAHAYATSGSYTVTLRVTDNLGATAQTQKLVTVSAPAPSGGTATRWEETDSRVVRGPTAWSWGAGTNAAASRGGYLASATAGTTLRFTFTGTGFSWIGVSDSCSGMAQVTVDGVSRVVDTYNAALTSWQYVTHSVTGLASASHTVELTVLGTKRTASCGAWVYFDAIDVIGSPAVPSPPTSLRIRVQESDPKVVRGPSAWSWGVGNNSAAAGGAFLASGTAGSTLTFTFTGTGVRIIGTVDNCSGQATVTLDNGAPASVDFYRAQTAWQQIMYQRWGLTRAAHTLRLQVAGTARSGSCGPWIYIDAFDVES